MSNTYNGWTNYATWRVNLEIFDGQSLRDLGMSRLDVYDLGDALKAYAVEIIEIDGKRLALDYAMAFLSDVNWGELARNYLHDEEVNEDKTEEEDA
jgi:hypothetical protein